MTHDDVRQLIDTHMEEEYELADADDLANLQNQVQDLSGKVASQAKQIATLFSDRNELLKLISIVAEGQGIEVRVEE